MSDDKKTAAEFLDELCDALDECIDALDFDETDFKGLLADMWNTGDDDVWDLYHKTLEEIDKASGILVDVQAEIVALKIKKEKDEKDDKQRDA